MATSDGYDVNVVFYHAFGEGEADTAGGSEDEDVFVWEGHFEGSDVLGLGFGGML